MKRFLKVALWLTAVAVMFIVAVENEYRWWWVKVGGVRGEKIHVRSEIDGVIQESDVTVPTTFTISAKKQAIDYRITKTMTNQDLWVNLVGPAWRQSYWAWWNDQAGVHISITKGYPTVMKMRYPDPHRSGTR